MDNKLLRKSAKQALNKLVELDKIAVKAYYEMGQLLHTIDVGAFYDILGYESLSHLVEEELTFSPSTAHKHKRLYETFKRLHYNKVEAIRLLQEFGVTHMFDVLSKEKTKLGKRAIATRIANLNENQINFTLTDEQLAECEHALEIMGAEKSDNGRWLNSSQVFMDIIREINQRHKKKAA
jgi:hypothetical protein